MINQKKKFNVIGMMSGTSMDGINASMVETDGNYLKRLDINYISRYKPRTRTLLKKALIDYKILLKDKDFKEEISYMITLDHFEAAKKLINKTSFIPDLVGFHGQTIYHNSSQGVSIQLGQSQLLSNLLSITVVSNFRDNDILFGGEGAPLAPIYHKFLMNELKLSLPTIFLNIGGVSNITYWDGETLIGFDTGPGNGLMDMFMQKTFNKDFDEDGNLASKGKFNNDILRFFQNHSYFKKKFPKSLDRSEFKDTLKMVYELKLPPCDAMATLAECTITSIIQSIKLLPTKPKNFIIMGGGVKNLYLLKRLKQIKKINVFTAKEKSLPGDFIESELIAYLTARHIKDLPITFPETTGVREKICGGKSFFK